MRTRGKELTTKEIVTPTGYSVVLYESYETTIAAALQTIPLEIKEPLVTLETANKKNPYTRWQQLTDSVSRNLESITNKLLRHLRHYANWIIFFQFVANSLLSKIPQFILGVSGYILPVGRFLTGFRLLNRYFPDKKERQLHFLMGLIMLGLSTTAIILGGLAFAVGHVSCNVVLIAWDIYTYLKRTFFSATTTKLRNRLHTEREDFYALLADEQNRNQFKLLKKGGDSAKNGYENTLIIGLSDLENSIMVKENHLTELNAILATKIHNAALILLTLLGMIMMFFPPTLIAGVSIVLAASIYGGFYGYDLNGKMPSIIRNFFFPKRERPDSDIELDKRIEAYKKNHKPLSSTAKTITRMPTNNPTGENIALLSDDTPENKESKSSNDLSPSDSDDSENNSCPSPSRNRTPGKK